MALHDITQIGYTESGVNTIVSNEASSKDIGDNALISKINTQLVDRDGQNKELTERNDAYIAILNQDVLNVKHARYNSLGEVLVEPTPAGQDLTTRINKVSQYYNEKKNVFDGLESTASLITKSTNVSDSQVLNDARLDEMESFLDPNSFKEIYDTVMSSFDATDVNTPAGFDVMMRREIKKLADNGSQEKGKCLVYKDENAKTFYELYIKNGLITLEEVMNPLKNIIQSYLIDNVTITDLHDLSNSKLVLLDDSHFMMARYNQNSQSNTIQISCLLFKYDGSKITKISDDFSTTIAVEIPDYNNIIDLRVLKIDNQILFYFTEKVNIKTMSKFYCFATTFDPVNEIIESSAPLFNGIITSYSTIYTGKYGSCNNNSYFATTNYDNGIQLFSKSSGILFNNISFGTTYEYIKTNDSSYALGVNSQIVCDENYIYAICKKVGFNETYLLKYNISDQSLVSTLQIPSSVHGRIWMIDGKIAFTSGTINYADIIIFADPITMTLIPDGDHNFAPISIPSVNNVGSVTLSDLGNSNMLLKSDKIYIITYDGYNVYSDSTNVSDHRIYGTSENTIIVLNPVLGGYILKYKTKPIYK